MKEKVENDSVAYIKSIAEQRGRNVSGRKMRFAKACP